MPNILPRPVHASRSDRVPRREPVRQDMGSHGKRMLDCADGKAFGMLCGLVAGGCDVRSNALGAGSRR
jgi:hypothetical protein